jgi:hypothetical protein
VDTDRDVHLDLLDLANELEGSLLGLPGRSGANSDRDSLDDLDIRHMPDDGESSEVGEESDNPIESSPTDDSDDDDDKTEELDGGDEWTGFGTGDNQLAQQDQVAEDTDIKEPKTRPSGMHHITGQCDGTDTSTGRYIPPGLREESRTSQGEDTVKLTRQLKGLINR